MDPFFELERRRCGAVVVLTGPSGVGKSTLVHTAQGVLKDLAFSVSHTTRAPRAGEESGIDYHFVSKAEFEGELAKGGFVEHALVHGNYYGTHRSELSRARTEGKLLLLDIDIQGAEQLRDANVADRFIFVMPPSLSDLESRLRGRGTESPESLERRLGNAVKEIEGSSWFDLLILNDDREPASVELICALRGVRLAQDTDRFKEQLGFDAPASVERHAS